MVRTKQNKPRQRKQNKSRQRKQIKLRKQKVKNIASVIKEIKETVLKSKPNTLRDAIAIALSVARKLKSQLNKQNSTGRVIKIPGRVIKIPKVGGVLPLIPIFAALSAMGSLGGAAAGVAKAVNDAKAARKQLDESNRHNRTMEAIAMGKGLFLKPYKTGLGIFLRPPQISGQGAGGGCLGKRKK